MCKEKIAYVTLLDQYHPGIYDSQVIDVCNYLNDNFDVEVQLIAFLSIKELWRSDAKKIIKSKCKNALVLPAFPKLRYFKLTQFLLATCLMFKPKKALICRNVFATQIGLFCRKFGLVKLVAFDGRSALSAEIKEYDVFPVPYFKKHIAEWERASVMRTNFQIAVSAALIDYWKDCYSYESKNNIIMPCTLASNVDWENIEQKETSQIKVVYAGSNAPWQGFEEISSFLRMHPNVSCTLLTKQSKTTDLMQIEFGERLKIQWVNMAEIPVLMAKHDYGLLLRPESVTNQVASPGKFAEYLMCGLKVIITKNLGDYSNFVENNNCGLVWDRMQTLDLKKTLNEDKGYNKSLAKKFFTKQSVINHAAYQKLIDFIIQS